MILEVQAQSSITYLFSGNYTGGKPGPGLCVYKFDPHKGKLSALSRTENMVNPSFLALSADGSCLYACTETKLQSNGNVSAFSVDSVKGSLIFINKTSAGGANPVNLTAHPAKPFLLDVNYDQGSAALFKTLGDGGIGDCIQLLNFTGGSINKLRQETSHLHAAVFSPEGDYVFLTDLGADKIRVFLFDSTQRQPLQPREPLTVNTAPGGGPRHLTFHPHMNLAYCIEELSGNVVVYSYDAGHLQLVQTIFSYSTKHEVYSSADIHLSPDGLFLYVSNRIENSLAIFAVQPQNGQLTLKGHVATGGDHPRNFVITASGDYLLVANQASNNIVVFKRDQKTGLLSYQSQVDGAGSPSCLLMRSYVARSKK